MTTSKYRSTLPQLADEFFMTDGGIETTLIFLDGLELPHFAAFHLLKTPEGEQALRTYFRTYGELAGRFHTGLILETATWRANSDWGAKLGYNAAALAECNRQAVRLLEDIRNEYETDRTPVVISGCIGPRGDGYLPDTAMSEREAEEYHRMQVETFAETAADLVTAITMTYAEEAAGIARAAKQAHMPVVISFTVETDGKLPTGQPLADAIRQVDDATSGYPAYFMINCAHPNHFDHILRGDEPWTERIRGLRANASTMSHAELNEASELDAGNPIELGRAYAALKMHKLKRLTVMGGCCGTDHRHVEQIASPSPLQLRLLQRVERIIVMSSRLQVRACRHSARRSNDRLQRASPASAVGLDKIFVRSLCYPWMLPNLRLVPCATHSSI